MQTWVVLPFANGEYRFALGLAQIVELERVCADGIGAIYARTRRGRYGYKPEEALPDDGSYRFSELIEIIRQALIGGNEGCVDGQDIKVSPSRANELIQSYILGQTDQRMILHATWALAFAVLNALIEGYTPPKKDAPGESPATPASD